MTSIVMQSADNQPCVPAPFGSKIDGDTYCQYMLESSTEDTLDTGSCLLSKVRHPILGAILLISDAVGSSFMISPTAFI